MDQDRFKESQEAYDRGDYRAAAKGFLAAAGGGTEGNGAAYHMAGNSLLKLRRFSDAATVYGHALKDDVYHKRGAVLANLAAAHVAMGEYSLAVDEYRAASEEPDYATPYKAVQGMAGALMEMGRYQDAAAAYRQAALDGANPDPGKALNNLGLCFMGMGRPQDAVEAYKAALGFDDYSGRGKALVNLGIALVSLGRHAEAVRTFERAIQLHGHRLSPQAIQAFETAKAATPPRETVDGWQTGELPPVITPSATIDVTGDLGSIGVGEDPGARELFAPRSGNEVPHAAPPADDDALIAPAVRTNAAAEVANTTPFDEDDEGLDSTFFTATDDELRARDRDARRAERLARRDDRNPWVFAGMAALIVIVVLGVMGGAYATGLGYPTQRMTVNGLLEAHAEGQPVEGFWVAVPEADVGKEMDKLPPVSDFTIDAVSRGARQSTASVTVTPESGAPLSYRFSLVREGVGWRVVGVENDWGSGGDED